MGLTPDRALCFRFQSTLSPGFIPTLICFGTAARFDLSNPQSAIFTAIPWLTSRFCTVEFNAYMKTPLNINIRYVAYSVKEVRSIMLIYNVDPGRNRVFCSHYVRPGLNAGPIRVKPYTFPGLKFSTRVGFFNPFFSVHTTLLTRVNQGSTWDVG